MLIGILSDSHDRADAMSAAVQLLQRHGAEFFVHCGDVGSERMLDFLAGLPAVFVWGNNDWDHAGLERYARKLGIDCRGALAELHLAGKSFAVLHGDDARLKDRILTAQQHDYLLHGHTHLRHDERIGRTRVINPGALHRAKEKTVALLDPALDRLVFFPIS